MKVDGRVSVVTGGASGMGRSLVCQLAQKGSHVACCDVNMKDLEETVRMANKINPNVKVTAHHVDVSNKDNVYRFADEVLEQHNGKVHLLFANAGLTKPGALIHDESMSDSDIAAYEAEWDKCFNIDYFGVLYCVRAFLKHIVKQDEGYMVITSSVNGFWTWPEHGCYTSAKFAVRGLTDSLLVETYMKAPHVHVACVHPGGVKTGIVKNSFAQTDGSKRLHEEFTGKIADLTSDEAADWILDGVDKNKTRILVGYDAICFDAMNRAGPHQAYNIWKALGKEGVDNFDATKPEILVNQLKNISVLGWVRILLNGGGRFLFFMWPVGIAMVRRTAVFKAALAIIALLSLRRISKM